MSLFQERSQERHVLTTQYLSSLEKSQVVATAKVAILDWLMGDLDSEANFDLAYFKGGFIFGFPAITPFDYGRLPRVCPVVTE